MTICTRLVGLVAVLVPVLAAQQAEPHSLAALLGPGGFVRIPAGEFSMGSNNGNPDEQPVRRAKMPRSFQMSKYEVTQAQWTAVMSDPHAAPYTTTGTAVDVNPSHFKGEARPVENVPWDAVKVFLTALNKRDPKHTYRLPTEAEWEYAAKAGAKSDPVNLGEMAWYKDNSGGETHEVGKKAPNAWGLYDMLGNVFEWVEDWYVPESYASGAPPAQGANPRSYKVFRGCGWLSEPKYCRPSYRMFDFPTQGQYSIGFRLVRVPR
ncbi:MAG TPA: formylglycine-generating enzyme family protein [Bryobacteraceae bacterium]|nr:formylglycine-generating enzyme family protein [Bryobacteraceae bacterium]